MPRADQPCTILIMHDLNSAAALIVRLPKLHTLFVKPRWPGTALRRSTREGSPSTPPHRDAGYGWFEKSSERGRTWGAGGWGSSSRLCRSMSQSPRTGSGLLNRFFILFEHELTQIRKDVGDQHTPVGGRNHQDEIGKHLGDLGRDLGDVGVFGLKVTLQQIVNLTVNAVGHFSSFAPGQRTGGSVAVAEQRRIRRVGHGFDKGLPATS